MLLAPTSANDIGAVDFIGSVAGAIEAPPPRIAAPKTAVLDPIMNPSSMPVASSSTIPVVQRPPSDPVNPVVVGGTMNNPTYNGQPAAGQAWTPGGYMSAGPSIGYGYTPPTLVKNFQAPTTAVDSSPTQLPTVTTFASNISTHWKLVAAIGLAIVLLVALFRFRR